MVITESDQLNLKTLVFYSEIRFQAIIEVTETARSDADLGSLVSWAYYEQAKGRQMEIQKGESGPQKLRQPRIPRYSYLSSFLYLILTACVFEYDTP